VQARSATRDEQRAEIQNIQSSTLSKLYKIHRGTEKKIENAVGYAVFSSASVAAIFFSGSYGHGIAHDNRDGRETYMQMAAAGVGLGLGAKDFRVVFVFNNADSFHDFVTTGLDLSGHADLAAKQGSKGKAVSGAQDILPGVTVYQMTKTGLLAQVMLKGTKYWADSKLNEADQNVYANRSFQYNK
jgi:lipid-binding SYLF domain-containing protein